MTDRNMQERKNVWPYIIWSIVILNLGGSWSSLGCTPFFTPVPVDIPPSFHHPASGRPSLS